MNTTLSKIHNTGSPKLYNSDYGSRLTMREMAGRIAADLKYEEEWKKIAEYYDRQKKGGK